MKKVKILVQAGKKADFKIVEGDENVNATELVEKLLETDKVKHLSVFGSKNGFRETKPLWVGNDQNRDLFYYNNGEITGFKNMAGVIRNSFMYGGEEYDVTLEIRSRFDTPERPWFMATMLSQIITGTEKFTGTTYVNNDKLDIFKFLKAAMFANMLKTAYQSGCYRTYVRKEYNDDRLRGAIDIPRQIRLNEGRVTASIAYVTREHTEDNPLNKLIVLTWKTLCDSYPGITDYIEKNDIEFYTAFKAIKELCHDPEMKELQGCIKECQRPVTGPYYADYEGLRQLCLNILYDEAGANLFSGTQDPDVCGILVYTPDLWELYLEKHLPMKDKFKAQDKLDIATLKDPKEVRSALNEGRKNEQNKIIPDFVYYNVPREKSEPFYIIDAKLYKTENLVVDKFKDGIVKLKRDMYFYSLRHYNTYHFCVPGALCSPVTQSDYKDPNNDICRDRFFCGASVKLFTPIVPDTENKEYAKWLNEFEKNMTNCMTMIEKELKTAQDKLISDNSDIEELKEILKPEKANAGRV